MRKKRNKKNSYVYYVYDLKQNEMCVGMFKDREEMKEKMNFNEYAVQRNLRRETFVKARYNISRIEVPKKEIEEQFR